MSFSEDDCPAVRRRVHGALEGADLDGHGSASRKLGAPSAPAPHRTRTRAHSGRADLRLPSSRPPLCLLGAERGILVA